MSARVALLDNARLKNQLVDLERRTSRIGRDVIDRPPGGHDDVANPCAGALVLALESVGGRLGLLEYMEQQLADIAAGVTRVFQPTPKPEPPPKPVKPLEPALGTCPACGSQLLKRISGCGLHCNQCGFEDASKVPVVHRLTRADIAASDWSGF